MALFFWDANGDQPVSAASLLNGHLGSADDLADLKGYDTTGLPNGVKAFLPDVGIYKFDSSSTATGDDFRVIDPTTGPGRWLLQIFGPEWVQDTNWITTFPSVDGNNYQYLGTDGAGVVSFITPANGPALFTQASHGFAAKDMIRHTGTAWTKAQGDTIPKCTGTWLVMAVDGDDFIAVKSGRVTVAGHGLTAGTLYYLSAATAGALTTTKPVGDTTTPLGFFLPAVYVESSSVLHVLGQQYPTFNPILARYVNTGFEAGSVTFSNLDVNSYGGSVEFEIGVASATNSGSGGEFGCTINGITSGYDFAANFDSGSAWTRHALTSQSSWVIAKTASFANFEEPVTINGKISLTDLDGTSTAPMVFSNFSHRTGMGISRGQNGAVANITSITFQGTGSITFRASASHYANLLWNGKIS